MQRNNTFVVISSAGVHRDLSKGTREQTFWDEHAAFIDGLVEEGFILLGGPLPDEGGAIIVVYAETEADARAKLKDDPWYVNAVLNLDSIRRWEIFIDQRS
jgi:uncharacterized protein YciI